MTTAPLTAQAQLARARTPARRQPAPVRQRASTAVLVVGTALSLGSLVGPDWALRAGVVVALLSAVASCALAWRELSLTKRRHAQDLLTVGRQHTESLRTERRHNAEVLGTVSDRARRWRQEVERQQTQIAGLRVESSALRSDLSSVRRRLVRADGVIAGLRETVRERDIEIALLASGGLASGGLGADGRHGDVGAEVRTLPRRVQLDRAEAAGPAGAEGRTVIDLRVDAPAMPNFEADRRRA